MKEHPSPREMPEIEHETNAKQKQIWLEFADKQIDVIWDEKYEAENNSIE